MREVLKTEFSQPFVEYMQKSMVVSFYKYGPLVDAYPHKVDAIKSLVARLDKYKETGNTEYLVDVANFAMIEYMHPKHPKAHFTPTDADGSPGRVNRKTGCLEPTNNAEMGLNPNSITAKFR